MNIDCVPHCGSFPVFPTTDLQQRLPFCTGKKVKAARELRRGWLAPSRILNDSLGTDRTCSSPRHAPSVFVARLSKHFACSPGLLKLSSNRPTENGPQQ